ncbi:MAG: M48 family metalloprotease [Alphaproteobacteria bacterium]|jgi:predicted Zn-dependent protease|nr:M48 family metalloprotease [Alphaproteobacteria bacterium]
MFKKIFIALTYIILATHKLSALSLIRDAQTEQYLHKISQPIFTAANLDRQIKIHIINDRSINAFVAGGKNIFINTGTITYSNSPLGLIGIIAHETGHITGSHLARMSLDLQKINTQMALGYIIGIATAVAGRADAGQALIMGSSHIGERQFYSHSTKHEEAADEAALKLLDASKISAQGLLEFFGEIKSNEKLYTDQINPYTRTHPLTNDRMNRIQEHLNSSPYTNVLLAENLLNEFTIIKTKLEAFLEDPLVVIENYSSDTEHGKLALVIANHRLGKSKKSLDIFKTIQNKDSAFMQELKGQIQYESGMSVAAVKTLLEVEKQLPDISLVKIELAAAIISAKKIELYKMAIAKLNQALITETDNVTGWRYLARLYHLTQNQGLSLLSLAEAEFFAANYDLALKYANSAKKILKKENQQGSIIRAEDIIKFSKEKKDV